MAPSNKKRKFHLVTVLFSLLLGVAACCLLVFNGFTLAGSVLPSLLVMGFSWLSIHLALRREHYRSWILLGMKMLLFFIGMPWVTFLIIMCSGDHETYPLVVVIRSPPTHPAISPNRENGSLAYWGKVQKVKNNPIF